jgi:hypothetical protein
VATMSSMRFGRIFVLGGTGMLEAATTWLAAHADALTIAARRPALLAEKLGATPLAIDWLEEDIAGNALVSQSGMFDLAVIWLHDAATALSRACEDVVRPGGRVIRVHGSLSVDPEVRQSRAPDSRSDVDQQAVILGFHCDARAEGGKRWLSHAEISAGVIAAAREPALETMIIGGAGGS